MGNKKTVERVEETFDLNLDHIDLIDMMNDPQVSIDDGNVSSNQILTLVLKKAGGSETILKDITPGEQLVIRFKKVTINQEEASFNDIDIT